MATDESPPPTPASTLPDYEPRVLVYFDILGWKEMVKDSVGNREMIARLSGILEFTQKTTASMGSHFAMRFTHFSDHVVMSANFVRWDGIGHVCLITSTLVTSLLVHGFYTRGAVVIGDLIHKQNSVFGPALVEAHKIESEVAKYPRIVFSRGAEEAARQSRAPVRTDVDSLMFLDVLATAAGDLVPLARSSLNQIRHECQQAQRAGKKDYPLDVQAKHGWLDGYVRTAEERLKATPMT
jgi:hypothetical protein